MYSGVNPRHYRGDAWRRLRWRDNYAAGILSCMPEKGSVPGHALNRSVRLGNAVAEAKRCSRRVLPEKVWLVFESVRCFFPPNPQNHR